MKDLIDIEIASVEKELKDSEEAVESLKKEIDNLALIAQKKEDPYRAKIKAIDKEYVKKTNPLARKRDKHEVKIRDLGFQIKALDSKRFLTEVYKRGTIETRVDFDNIMHVKMRGYNLTGCATVIRKPLKNGLRLVRIGDSDEDHVNYYVFDGLRLVGFHFCRKAQHIADEATYKSWIGKKNLTDKNSDEIRVTKVKTYSRDHYQVLIRPGFRPWKAYIEKKQVKKLDAITMNNDNIKELQRTY